MAHFGPMSTRADIPSERFWFTKLCAGAMAAGIAIYGAYAWAVQDEWGKAAVCLIAQLIAINCAIAARRAFARQTPAALPAVLIGVALVGAWFSHEGLHHAWTAGGAEIWAPATFALAAMDPFLFWTIDAVEQAPRKLTAEQQAEKALEEQRAYEAARAETLRAQAELERARAAPSPEPAQPRPREPARARGNGPVQQLATKAARDRAQELIKAGHKPWTVHRETKVPLSTLKRWQKDLAA